MRAPRGSGKIARNQTRPRVLQALALTATPLTPVQITRAIGESGTTAVMRVLMMCRTLERDGLVVPTWPPGRVYGRMYTLAREAR